MLKYLQIYGNSTISANIIQCKNDSITNVIYSFHICLNPLPWQVALDRDTLWMFRLPFSSLATNLLLLDVQLVAGVAADLQHAAVRVGSLTCITTCHWLKQFFSWFLHDLVLWKFWLIFWKHIRTQQVSKFCSGLKGGILETECVNRKNLQNIDDQSFLQFTNYLLLRTCFSMSSFY